MFNLTKKLIVLNDTVFQIDRFEVWFRTPFGLHQTLDDAIKHCVAREIDPEIVIVPVPVALAGNTYEVLLR